jgi:hypothetical protein
MKRLLNHRSSDMKITIRLIGVAMAVLLVVALTGSTVRAESTPSTVSIRIKCGLQGVTVSPGTPKCQSLNGWFGGVLEWVSGGTVLFQENGPFFGVLASDEVLIFPDGNGNPTTFDSVYVNPETSILIDPNLTMRLYFESQQGLMLALEQPYIPQAGAVWAKHSEDTFKLQAGIDAEAAARAAADTVLQSSINGEAAARVAADTALQQNLNAEAAARAAADTVLQSSINGEAAARIATDAALQASTNAKVSAVSASPPLASTGGTSPNISLASCAEGQVLKFTSGQWRCVDVPATIVRRISATACFQQPLQFGLPGVLAEMRLGSFSQLETEGIGPRTPRNSATLYCPIPSDSILPHSNIDRVEVRGWGSSLCEPSPSTNCPPFVLAYLCVSFDGTASGQCTGFRRSEVRGGNYAITFTRASTDLVPWTDNPNGYPYVRVDLTIPSFNGDTSTLRGITISGRSGL